MKAITCVWCHTPLQIDEAQESKRAISHSICSDCHLRMMKEPLEQYLDRLGVPVLAVESGPRIKIASKEAQKLLGKTPDQIEGHRGGEVIECEYAYEPGGCGQQEHCKACTIRRTVLDTFSSGRSYKGIKSYPPIIKGKRSEVMCITISTEKVGDYVLLRIDEMGPYDTQH